MSGVTDKLINAIYVLINAEHVSRSGVAITKLRCFNKKTVIESIPQLYSGFKKIINSVLI